MLVGLGVLDLIWYLVSGIHRPTEVATPATAPATPAHLALSNDSSTITVIITVSDRVHDEATRARIDLLSAPIGKSGRGTDLARQPGTLGEDTEIRSKPGKQECAAL